MLPGRFAKNGVGAGRLISSSLWYITGGGGLGIFLLVGGPNFGSKGTVGLFCGKLLLTETTTCFSICERQSPIGYPKTIFFLISLECSLVAKFTARFIEIISHFKSDIRSCRCNNSSIKQVSGLIGGSGAPGPPSPLDPPLYQRARPPVFPICKHPLYRPTSHTTSFSTLQLRLYSAVLNASVEQQK